MDKVFKIDLSNFEFNDVQFDEATNTLSFYNIDGDKSDESVEEEQVTVPVEYETTVIYGVNFRDKPVTTSKVYRMLSKNEKIHVIESQGNWLKIEVKDGTIGYISSSSKYTNYKEPELSEHYATLLIKETEKYMGAPYVFGAKIGEFRDGVRVFDCSSLVKTVVKDVLKKDIPRTSYNQATIGPDVSRENLKVGDLMFFSSRGLPIGHVGIYAGKGKIIHTYSTKYGVRYSDFTGQWSDRFVKAVRVI